MVGDDDLDLQSTWDVQTIETKHSRMDQVKIDQVISNFLNALSQVHNYFFRDLSETFTVFTTTPGDGLSFKVIVLQLY